MTAAQMVAAVKAMTGDWAYDVISMGIPTPVRHGQITQDPENLGPGWVDFAFSPAFGKPVRIINDAAMQALGSDQGGVMLFLGLGTGLGSALVMDGRVQPLELGQLPFKKQRTFEDTIGNHGRVRLGNKRWRRAVTLVVDVLVDALLPDYVVLGGGNARRLKALPRHCRLGDNGNAFTGGLKLWTNPSPDYSGVGEYLTR